MLRPLFAVPISALVLSGAAHASVLWTVGPGAGHDFFSIDQAVNDSRVQDGHSIKVLGGGYLGFDSGNKALRFEPGNSPGIVDVFGQMALRQNSCINFEIGGYNSGLSGGLPQFDQFIVTGNVDLDGGIEVTLIDGFMPVFGDSWALIQAGGSIDFNGMAMLPELGGGLSWNVQVVSGSGEFGPSGSSLVATVVPTPGAAALVALAGVLASRRRR
jgi:MYXO-CTERM domain-containing protein